MTFHLKILPSQATKIKIKALKAEKATCCHSDNHFKTRLSIQPNNYKQLKNFDRFIQGKVPKSFM